MTGPQAQDDPRSVPEAEPAIAQPAELTDDLVTDLAGRPNDDLADDLARECSIEAGGTAGAEPDLHPQAEPDLDPQAEPDPDPQADPDLSPEGGPIASGSATVASTGEDPVSRDVVRRAVTGDDGAFAMLVEHHDAMLRELAYHLLQDPADTDDVLAASYLRAYRALPRLRPPIQPGPWLCRITYLACLDALRRRYRRRRPAAPSGTSGDGQRDAADEPAVQSEIAEPTEPTEPPEPAEPAPMFERTFDALPADQRATVLLSDADGFDTSTVAEVLDRSEAIVAAMLARARAALSVALADDPGETEPGDDAPTEQPDPRIPIALAALRERRVPEHGDDFWPTLGERLIAEREAPAAPTFDPLERLGQGGLRVPGEARDKRETGGDEDGDRRGRKWQARRRRRRRKAEAARPMISHLAEHAERVNPRRPNWRRRVLVTTSAVVIGTVIGVAVWLGATAERASPTTTAGQVATGMSQRLEGARYILGGVITAELGTGNGRYSFVRSIDGSFRYRGVDHRSDTAYNTRTGLAASWRMGPGGTIDASRDRGLAPGPPDADGASRYLRDDELGAIIRNLEASPAVLAKSRTSHGRKVWVIDVRLPASADAPVDNVRVVVDEQRRLPIEVSRSVRGKVIQRKRFTDLRQASTVRGDTFQVSPPTGGVPAALDHGFQRVRLTAVRSAIGYPAVTPKWLPRGFELTTVAVLAGSPAGLQSTAGGDNPPNRDVVSLAYRRGIEQVTVTVRRVADPSEQWKDPFSTGRIGGGRVQRVRLDGGRYLGTTVEQVVAPGAATHLWGRSKGFVFTVAGDLDPSQLLRVANSLA